MFRMICSACELNEQRDGVQPGAPFPVFSKSVVPCTLQLLLCSFLRRQVRWSGIPVSKNFPQFIVIHTIKGFSGVSEVEADVFLEFPCFPQGTVLTTGPPGKTLVAVFL